MADSFIQLPADSTGKQLDTALVNMGVGTTAVHREKVVVSDPLSTTGFATVTSSAGLLASLSSGTVTLSSTPTVTATSATNPWSSAPGFNIPVVTVSSGLTQISGTVTVLSASSGLVQISGTPTILSASSGFIQAWPAVTPTSSVAGAALGPVTSSAGQLVSLSSGTVSLSSQITVTATGPVTITSGTVSLSSQISVTATAATNPWSSAPGFNLPVVSVSSGVIQLSSQITVTATGPVSVTSGTVTLSSVHTIFSASSGGIQAFIPISPTSSVAGAGFGPVTSSAGVLASLSSGTISLSSQISVTATAGTNPWSSAPGFNVPVVTVSSGLVQISGTPTVLSASSGLVQISGTPLVNLVGTSSAIATVTSSGGLNVSIVAGAGAGSTQVHIVGAGNAQAPVTSSFGLLVNQTTASIPSVINASSANPTPVVIASSNATTLTILSASSGLVQISGTVTVLNTSSGFVQISGTPTVLSASSGFIQVWPAVTPTSSVAGAALGPVTSSAGVLATISSGTISLSSQISVTATAGTNPWSSAPGFNVPVVTVSSGLTQISGTVTILSASSGLVQISGTPAITSTSVILSTAGITQVYVVSTAGAVGPVTSSAGQVVNLSSGTVTLSSVHTVTATAGTNPWSSAPGFNLPVVSVSSGLVQSILIASVTSAPAILSTWFQSTGGAASVLVNSSPGNFRGYALFNSTAAIRSVKIYNTSSAPGIGSTVNIITILEAPGSTGGGGANMMITPPGVFASNGLGFTMTANIGATDTGAPGLNDVTLTLFFV